MAVFGVVEGWGGGVFRDPEMNLKYIATGTGTAMLSFVFVFLSLVSEEYSGLDGLCREMLAKKKRKKKGEGGYLLVEC